MTEDLLHHLWKFRLFSQTDLISEQGNRIEIVSAGKHNTDSGPDFFDARIKIDNTLWAGNVEIHIKSSDWFKHNHQHDRAFDNIILHVVFEDDLKEVYKPADAPLLVLQNYISKKTVHSYDALMLNQNKIPCADSIGNVDELTINSWLDRVLMERLELKTETIAKQLELTQNNWEETFYIHLAKNFGFKVNAVPFEMLARSLPIMHLAKHKSNLFQIEALLFGQSGFLFAKFKDDYPNELKREYEFLQKKFNLQPIEARLWKFMRMRPVNFPTIRIAQFAQLIYKSSNLFSKLIELKDVKAAYDLFDLKVSDYWKTHFVFDKLTEESEKHFGDSSIENVMINSVVPFLFHYSKTKDDSRIQNRAISFLEKLPEENNHIISKWKLLKVPVGNAYRSQALIHQYNNYCTAKKCLFCGIGNKILKQN